MDDVHFGVHKEMLYARNVPAVKGAQWTGIVTQIAIEMLESGRVEAVVCVQSDEHDRFKPKPVSHTLLTATLLLPTFAGLVCNSLSIMALHQAGCAIHCLSWPCTKQGAASLDCQEQAIRTRTPGAVWLQPCKLSRSLKRTLTLGWMLPSTFALQAASLQHACISMCLPCFPLRLTLSLVLQQPDVRLTMLCEAGNAGSVQVVARTKQDILKAGGVKPTLSPNLNTLATVEALGVKRLLFIGVGCQVKAVHTACKPSLLVKTSWLQLISQHTMSLLQKMLHEYSFSNSCGPRFI